MQSLGKKILYGALLWVSVFLGAVIVFPVKNSDPIFFETLITIILTGFSVLYSVLYFKKGNIDFSDSVVTGLIWMIINIVIDLPLFSYGPMARPLVSYVTDIGLTYLVIPVITSGIGYLWMIRSKK